MQKEKLYQVNRNYTYLLIRKYIILKLLYLFFGLLSFCFAMIPHLLFPILPDRLSVVWTCSNLNSLLENGQRESFTLFLIRCFRALHSGTNASLALVGISHQQPQGPAFTFPRPHCRGSSQPLLDLPFSNSQSRHLSTAGFTTPFHLISTTHPRSHCALSV